MVRTTHWNLSVCHNGKYFQLTGTLDRMIITIPQTFYCRVDKAYLINVSRKPRNKKRPKKKKTRQKSKQQQKKPPKFHDTRLKQGSSGGPRTVFSIVVQVLSESADKRQTLSALIFIMIKNYRIHIIGWLTQMYPPVYSHSSIPTASSTWQAPLDTVVKH